MGPSTLAGPSLARGAFSRAWRLSLALGTVLGLVACLDDSPVATGKPTVRASFSANIVGSLAGGTVGIRIGYRTRSQQLLFLPSTPQQVNVAGGTTTVVPVTVDIGRCLADGNRAGAGEPGCRLTIQLTLSEPTGTVVDSTTSDAGGEPTVPGGSVNFGTVTVGAVVASVVVTPTTLRMSVGQQQQLTATARDAKGAAIPSVPVTWTTNDPTVAQLTVTGLSTVVVRALKLGQATVTASARGKTSEPVTLGVALPTLGIRQLPGAGCVIAGQTVTLDVDSPPGPVSWSSSDPSVATVGASTGVVTGIKPGESATITATSGGITGTATVCVAMLRVSEATLSVLAGGSTPLTVFASGGTVSFVSSTPAVATVDAAGVVRGIAIGTATITAKLTAASGSQSVAIPTTVAPGSVAIKVTLSKAPLGRSVKYAVLVQDANGVTIPDVTVTWSVADPTIASLSGTTGDTVEVKALKLGSTTISATVAGVVATAQFTGTPIIPATRLEQVSGNGAACPTYSTTCTLIARAVDADGFPVTGETVRWSTSNQGCGAPKTATTDAEGLTTTTNLCTSVLPGLYEQTVALTNAPAVSTFHYTLRGLVLTLQSFDTSGVATYAVSSTTPAQGLSVKVAYVSGPGINYVTTLDLNGTTTPAVLVVGYDRSDLPLGQYSFEITVSTTTPGLGPAVVTESFSAPAVILGRPNAQSVRPLLGAPGPVRRREP